MKPSANSSHYWMDLENVLRDVETAIEVVANYTKLKYFVQFSGPLL